MKDQKTSIKIPGLHHYIRLVDSVTELIRPVRLLRQEDLLRGECSDDSYDFEALRKLTEYRVQYVQNYDKFTELEKGDLTRLFGEAHIILKTKMELEESVH